jgi:ParB/RepB/Spo0J family partition protein
MTATDIELRHLQENQYNPRIHFDDANMADLQDSIESEGLDQALTVRQVSENGTYEVVSGMRRLFALREIHGDDSGEEIPCNVRDLDDEDAKWAAFNENEYREDLSVYEEAVFFGNNIEVEYRELTEDDIGEDGDREPGPITESYADYLKASKCRARVIQKPTRHHSTLKEAADRSGISASTIAKRLSILCLPADARQLVKQGNLPAEHARRIARLRQVVDPDRREDWMNSLAKEYAEKPDGRSEKQKLAKEVSSKIEKDEEERERKDEQLNEYRELVTERQSELRSALSTAQETYEEEANKEDFDKGEFDEELKPGPDTADNIEAIDEAESDEKATEAYIEEFADGRSEEDEDDHWLRAQSQQAISIISGVRASLRGEELDELNDEQDSIQIKRDRLKKNIETVREEHLSRCPYCQSGLHIDDLEDRVDTYNTKIEAIEEQKKEKGDISKALNEVRSSLRSALNKYNDALESLRDAKRRAGVDDSDANSTDGSQEGGG